MADFSVETAQSVMNILRSHGENIKDIRLVPMPLSKNRASAKTELTFVVECGVLPKDASIEPKQRVPFNRMTHCIMDAIAIARDKFPESVSTENTTRHPWAIFEVNFMRNYILLEYKRGDRDIWVRAAVNIRRHLPQEIVWFSRASYLNFTEGCQDASGHIARYLMNQVAQQNVCEYMIQDKFDGEMSDPTNMRVVMLS